VLETTATPIYGTFNYWYQCISVFLTTMTISE
jgi:hypothetical protein